MVNQVDMVNLIISDIWNRLYNLIWVESYYPLVNPLYEQHYLFKHGWMWRHLLARGLQVLPSCLLCYCVKSQYKLYMFKNIWNASLIKISPLFKYIIGHISHVQILKSCARLYGWTWDLYYSPFSLVQLSRMF